MGKHGGKLVIGERVIHKRHPSRGTFMGRHGEEFFLVHFDDGDLQNVHVGSIHRLLKRDLLKEERFNPGDRVKDAVSGRWGWVGETPNGDRVPVIFGLSREVIPARRLVRE